MSAIPDTTDQLHPSADPKLLACLPDHLRTPGTTIAPVAVGNSGAGVYLVDSAAGKAILKITPSTEPVDVWTRTVAIQQAAAASGVAAAVLHTDVTHRAVLSAFVADRSLPAFYGNPQTRSAAIDEIGRMIAHVHAIPAPASLAFADPLPLLTTFWNRLQPHAHANEIVPPFAYEAAQRFMRETPPAAEREMVLSHNDMNPTNLVFDGAHVLALDWQTVAVNDPYYDLATIAMFLRMEEATSLQLLSAYDGRVVTGIPARFTYSRRMAAIVSGSAFLYIARERGYNDAHDNVPVERTSSLADLYAELRSGALQLSSAGVQWRMGLALIKEGIKTWS